VRSIDDLIGSNAALRQLGEALARRNALLQRVRQALPDEVAHHCVAAEIEDHALRLLADSAGWATRLRYFARDLVRRLRADGVGVATLEVRVLPPDTRTDRLPGRAVPHSDDAAVCLEHTAAGIDDPALRAALQRLGRRLRR